jgi:hypothetical protein
LSPLGKQLLAALFDEWDALHGALSRIRKGR